MRKTGEKLGITQKELTEKIGVNEGTIRNWSSKGNPPKWAIRFMKLLLKKENKIINKKNENLVEVVCREFNISQKKLADMLDVSPSTISMWNTGNLPKITKMLFFRVHVKK